MDFDKLQAALSDKEVADLFAERRDCLKGIKQAEGNLEYLREQLGEIQGKIAEKIGGDAKPETTSSRETQKCGDCEKLGINNGGDHKRAGAKHDKYIEDNRSRLIAEGKLKEAA